MFTKRIATVSVINDLVTDNRVLRTAGVLHDCGYRVQLIGRQLPRSLPIPDWPYEAERMKMIFRKGPAFYGFFNLRLFFRLLFRKSALLVSNDLDTLLPNYLVSKLRGIPLLYDSHELFCEVPELANSRVKRRIWLALEKWIVPRLRHCITVNDSIAGIFQQKYGQRFHVIRNIAEREEDFKPKTRAELNLPIDKKILLLQGAGINIDRGAEELIEAMTLVDNALLLIIGSGDVWEILKHQVVTQNLNARVRLIPRLPKSELRHYTANADIGLSIDKNTNLNYFFSLPNKIFDYIHAGLPILASRMPEIERIVENYRLGAFIDNHRPAHIAAKIMEMLTSEQLPAYRQNCLRAAESLNWRDERQKLIEIVNAVGRKT